MIINSKKVSLPPSCDVIKLGTINSENSTLNSKSSPLNRPKRGCKLLKNDTNVRNHTKTDVGKKPANFKNNKKANLLPSHPILKHDAIPSVLPKYSTSKLPLLSKPSPINRPKRESKFFKIVENVRDVFPDLPKNSTLNLKKPPSPKPHKLRRSKRGNKLLENNTNIEDERKKQNTKNYTYGKEVSASHHVLYLADSESNLNPKKRPHQNPYLLNQHKNGNLFTDLPKNSTLNSKKPPSYQLRRSKTGNKLLENDTNIDEIEEHINTKNFTCSGEIPPSHPGMNLLDSDSNLNQNIPHPNPYPLNQHNSGRLLENHTKSEESRRQHINTENYTNNDDKKFIPVPSHPVLKSNAITSTFSENPKNLTLNLNEGQQSDICLLHPSKRAKKSLGNDTNIEDSRIKQINMENYTNYEAIIPSHPVLKQSSILSFFHEKVKNLNLKQNKCSLPNPCRTNQHKKGINLLKIDINMENLTNMKDNIKMSIQEADNVKLPEFWTKLKFKEDPSCVAFGIWNTGEIDRSTSRLNHPNKLVRVKEKDNGQLICTVYIGSVIVKQQQLLDSVLTLERIIEEADKTTFNFEEVIIKQENSLDSLVTLERIIDEAQKMTVHVGNEIIKQYESLASVVTLESIEKTLAQCIP